MKHNPFKGTKFSTPVVASELRFGTRGERAIGNNGEMNAGSKVELMQNIAKLLEVAGTQGVDSDAVALKREQAGLRREFVTAAFNSAEAHQELGELMGDDLYQAGNREGFMRRFLLRQELSQGQHPQVWMRMKNVTAKIASSPSRIQTQLVRDNVIYPPEFTISARPFIEKRLLDQSVSDVLDEKYVESLEGIMVGEDRVMYNLAKSTVGVENNQTQTVGSLDPTTLSVMRNNVTRFNIPATSWWIANDIWQDIVGNSGFQQIIDPVSKFELLNTGLLGRILGMDIYSDGYRHPQHKVLSKGEHFVLGKAENLGQYTDRGGIDSQPIDGATEGIPGKGWFLSESISIALVNARAVSYGRRV